MEVWRPMGLLIRTVSEVRGVPASVLESAVRTHDVTLARSEVFWLADKLLSLSMSAIGRSIGGRDHANVTNGIARVDDKMSKDVFYASEISELRWLAEIELCGLNKGAGATCADDEAQAIARSVLSAPSRAPDFPPHDLQALARVFLKQSVRLAQAEGFVSSMSRQIDKFNERKTDHDLSHPE